jgi:hypothetical protein
MLLKKEGTHTDRVATSVTVFPTIQAHYNGTDIPQIKQLLRSARSVATEILRKSELSAHIVNYVYVHTS